jgi:hypothetical protein
MLARALDDCELVLIDDAGHGGGASTTAALIAATDGFARDERPRPPTA